MEADDDMRRILAVAVLLATGLAHAQVPAAKTVTVDTTITLGGACVANTWRANATTLYRCSGGVWVAYQPSATPAGSAGDLQTYATSTTLGTSSINVGALGPRGASADASGDGMADNKLYPTIKSNSGQPLYVTPEGIGTVRGLPDRGIEPVVVIGLDDHPSDASSFTVAKAIADTYNIPLTVFPTRYDSGDTYPSSANVQAWTANGGAIGAHTARHDMGGYDSIDGNPNLGNATSGGRYTTGTAACTNGSTAVVGTGTNWDPANYPVNTSIQSEQMYFICDYDNDNIIANGDRPYAILVASIADATHLTLAKAFAGTTTSGPANHNYEMHTGYPKANWEIKQGVTAIQAILGSGWIPGSMNDPGTWNPSDDVAVLAKAAQGIPYATAVQGSYAEGAMSGWMNFGSVVDPLRVNMELTNCYWKASDMANLVATIIAERGFWQVNLEDVVATGGTCNQSGSWITQVAFDALLSAIATARDAGLLRVMTADDAARYVRSIPNPQFSTNIIRNYSGFMMTSGAVGTGLTADNYAFLPGWGGVDSNAATAGVQHAGKTGTWTGEGGNSIAYTKASSGEYDEMVQCFQLHPDQEYYVAAELDCTAVTSGNITLRLTDYFRSSDTYAATNATDMTSVLDPVWFKPMGYLAGSSAGFGYTATGYSHTCTAGYSTWTAGYFRTPSLLNEPVCLRLAETNAVGTARWKNLSMVARHPNNMGTAWGSGMGLKFSEVSRAAPYATGGYSGGAFNFHWLPSDNSYDSSSVYGPNGAVDTVTRSNTPAINLVEWSYRKPDASASTVQYTKVVADGIANEWLTGYQYSGACADTAGAATVTADNCSMITLTGTSAATTTLNTCNAANKGRVLTVICGSTATSVVGLTDGGNMKLSANFVCTADDSITVVCDGSTNCSSAGCWIETARAVN